MHRWRRLKCNSFRRRAPTSSARRYRESSGMKFMRFWWGFGVFVVLAALVVCLVPFQETPGTFKISDKASHLAGHGALALYFAGLVPRQRWWKIFVFLLGFGAAIEFAQYAMQVGRDGDARDVIA